MAKGRPIGPEELAIFSKHFEDYQEQYVLIGGSATKLLLNEADLFEKSTQDMDLVLCAKALTKDFVAHFWKFIQDGQYRITRKSSGNGNFYRFDGPGTAGYPSMIELLSEKAELLASIDQTALPMVVDEDIISLSAIVLDQENYNFLMANRKEMDGIVIADEHAIIPLKIAAFFDLTKKKVAGIVVKGSDITKHRNDVLRLSVLLKDVAMNNVPVKIKVDVEKFLGHLKEDNDYFGNLKLGNITMEEIKEKLKVVNGIG